MKLLLTILGMLVWNFPVLADDTSETLENFEELSIEVYIVNGQIHGQDKLVKHTSTSDENEFFPSYIPVKVHALCITRSIDLELCHDSCNKRLAAHKLEGHKVYNNSHFAYISDDRAAIGVFVSHFREKSPRYDYFGVFTNMRILYLPDNSLVDFDKFAFNGMKDLESLNLNFNNLTTLRKEMFKENKNLKFLSIEANQIFQIESQVFTHKKLIKLLLGRNRLESLDWKVFVELKALELLDLSNNLIETIRGIDNHKYIPLAKPEKYDLQHANEPDVLIAMRHLNLQGNRMKEVDLHLLTKIPNLEVLNLAENLIYKIEPNTFNLVSKLTNLDLRGNQLSLPHQEWYKSLSSNDVKIDLSDNEWKCNCKILTYGYFLEKEREKPDQEDLIQSLEVVCFKPDMLKGRILNKDAMGEISEMFSCQPEDFEEKKQQHSGSHASGSSSHDAIIIPESSVWNLIVGGVICFAFACGTVCYIFSAYFPQNQPALPPSSMPRSQGPVPRERQANRDKTDNVHKKPDSAVQENRSVIPAKENEREEEENHANDRLASTQRDLGDENLVNELGPNDGEGTRLRQRVTQE